MSSQSPFSLLPVCYSLKCLSVLEVSALVSECSLVAYLCFKRYEPDTKPSLFTLLVLAPGCLSYPFSFAVASKIKGAIAAFTIYHASIMLYALIYRLSPWHPLAGYPGPLLARTSKIWGAVLSARGTMHTCYKDLHDRYGDVVRVGPNELSIRDASIIPAILGPGGLPKGPFWANRSEPDSLILIRDPMAHARARKPWERAFAPRALKEYDMIIAKRARELVQHLDGIVRQAATSEKKLTAALDINTWLGYFTVDFMGDMAFGGAFEFMADRADKQGIWRMLSNGLAIIMAFGHISWFIPVINFINGGAGPLTKFGAAQVHRRLRMGSKRKDIFYYLSGEDQTETDRPPLKKVAQQGLLAMIAGSDTTSTAMTALFYYLLQNPTAYARLQEEVDAAFPHGDEPLDVSRLNGLEWLGACINEALRLQPPVPDGSQRTITRGTGPRRLGSHLIPDQTQILLHTYTIHRDPRNFYSPDAFRPERWLASGTPMGTHNPTAFFPFSFGPTACAGKALALMEMRMVVCWLLRHFHFAAAPGNRLGAWEESLRGHFVMYRGPLMVEVSLRE
ncbi:high nitrogen upregulated cytochrome P450 monooxygenase 2 [Gloeopeniophorella convolvens]|nr:high nitrogen upregulated cytochrome P450 monooxygenase 2 [Gloeopeniophorella convolvens]